jgi:uncharacterized protein
VRSGANVDAQSYYKWTPLQLAARNGNVKIVEMLLSAGADVNCRGFHGWTALHYAVRYGRQEVVQVLLSAGADPDIRDNDGKAVCQGMKAVGVGEGMYVFRSTET